MTYELLFFLIYRISLFFEILFLLGFLPVRQKKGTAGLAVVGVCILMTALDYFDFFIFAPQNRLYHILNTLLQTALLMGFSLFLSVYRDFRTVCTTLCAANFVFIGNILGVIWFYFMGSAAQALLLTVLIHAGLLFFLFRVMRVKYLMELQYGNSDWKQASILPVLTYMVVYGMTVWPGTIQDNPQNCLPLFLMFLLMIGGYCMATTSRKRLREKLELASKVGFMENYTEYILREADNTQKNRLQMEIMRHDMRHRYRMIAACLKNGQYEEIKEMISQFDEELDGVQDSEFCENQAVNGVLALYAARAEKAGINFNCKADAPAECKVFNDFGFLTMLSNLLENAVLAAEHAETEADRIVKVRIQPRKEQILLEIQNSYEGAIRISPETGLPVYNHRERHGFGLLSVKNYAEQQHALFHMKIKDDRVITQYMTNI